MAAKVSLQCTMCHFKTTKLQLGKAQQHFSSHLQSRSRVAKEGFIRTDWSRLWFDSMEETEEVNSMETVMMDAMPSAIVFSNLPKVEQISSPCSNPSPTPEDRSCCPSFDIQIMNQGPRLDSGSNNTFSEDFPARTPWLCVPSSGTALPRQNGDEDWDTQSWCTLPGSELCMVPLADSLAKTDSGVGDEDTQTDSKVCYILPSSQQLFEDSTSAPWLRSLTTKSTMTWQPHTNS
jgi:hypothetical protein